MATSGRCLCGAVQFEVNGPLRGVLVCHCTECRRWSGHAWAATAAAHSDLRLIEDQTLRWLDSPASDTNARRGFCAACGSSLFWDAPGRATISISAGSLDEPTGLEVIGHVYVEQAGDYYALPDDGVPHHAWLQDSRGIRGGGVGPSDPSAA
jgi:hypothetical protein